MWNWECGMRKEGSWEDGKMRRWGKSRSGPGIWDRKAFKGRIWIKEVILERVISNELYRKDRWSMRLRAKLLPAAQYSVFLFFFPNIPPR
jgi:hypothetical protein